VPNDNQKLGRGFDSLIPVNFDARILSEDKNRVKNVLITDITPYKNQPRQSFDEKAHQELVVSVKKHGILQPLIVVSSGDGYSIVAGERRFRAAKDAGLTELPVIVRTLEELERLEIALVENVQRVDLSPLEQAASIHVLHTDYNLTYEEISARLGKAVTTIQNIVRLLQLSNEGLEALRAGHISEGHARSLLSLKDDLEGQTYLLNAIKTSGWSVRQAEQFVAARKKGAVLKKASPSAFTENEYTKKLSAAIRMPVKLQQRKKGGRLIIDYKNENELRSFLKKLSI
jgi:ParB family transcriptional regulator, chromosome partitioning protein